MNNRPSPAAVMRPDGKVQTGRPGKYVVLGWRGKIDDILQGALKILPTPRWEDNELVGVYRHKSSAVRAMRSKSRLRGIGDRTYFQLAIYLNRE